MASERPAALIHDRPGPERPVAIDSAEAATGRLGAVLAAPRTDGLTQLGPRGPWLATDLAHTRRVLTDAAAFDFPTTTSRGTDLAGSRSDTRTGHHVYAPLVPAQVERGSTTFLAEWHEAVARARTPQGDGVLDAMQALRRPVARATCAATFDGITVLDRNDLADQVVAWIDALAPVISSPRTPGRWSRGRRAEDTARNRLEATLATVLPRLGIDETPQVMAAFLAAGVQVPIAAGAWLLVLLADHPGREVEIDHVVWETLRIAPPTWMTGRVTVSPIELAGHRLAAGELVLVSPLLLGRLPGLVPDAADIEEFRPDRWRRNDHKPGSWLPFGAGAHACPGRNLGFRLLRDLATWAGQHELALMERVTIDQSRGILPGPARVSFAAPTQ